MDFFNTNRFSVKRENEQEFDMLLMRLSASDGSLIEIQKNVRISDIDDENIDELLYHLNGTGKLQFDADNVSQGMLKLTGNLSAFYRAVSPLIDSNDAMILSMTSIADDGWIAAKSAVVTSVGVEEIDLVGNAIATAASLLENEKYATDTHKFE